MATGTAEGVDPSADIRDEIAACSGVPELAGKIWFHKTAAAVIDAGRCVGCGGCIAACPSRSIAVGDDGHPTLTRMCTGCSACWDFCPLAGLRTERLVPDRSAGGLGGVLAAYSAKAAVPVAGAQDGGVVTELVAALIEQGAVDGAVLTRRRDAFHGEPFVATTPEEARAAAGSVYHQGHLLALLTRPLPPGVRTLAVVGTPCQLAVLSALQRFPWRYRRGAESAVTLAIGLFCTRSFDPPALQRALLADGVNLREVRKIDIRDGVLRAWDTHAREVFAGPAKELRGTTLAGCDECADFTALTADIAVGNVGSEPGRSTVLIRTPAGLDAWRAGSTLLHADPLLELEPVTRLVQRNHRRAERATPRPFDPEGPLWISHPEHLAAYAGTTRSPVSPPAHRSHNYEIGC